MELICPVCRNLLLREGDTAHCTACNMDYLLDARCPDCQQSLQVLKACGSVDYFCKYGHGLISKKRVLFSLKNT